MLEHQTSLGDCLTVMRDMPDHTVDMVYLDPPFFTGKDHFMSTRDGSLTYRFRDTWGNEREYSEFLYNRIKEMHRILKTTGSIFLHCDTNATHIARKILNSIFGPEHFRSEIIWHYKRWSNSQNGLLPQHQTIFYYTKSSDFTFNKSFTNYRATTNVDQILQKRKRDERGKVVYATDVSGDTIFGGAKQGVPLGDVWEIPFLNPKARERTGYPTQKPLLLLERIIEISTNVGDYIVDPFCGSGTTMVAAKLKGRRAMGIDILEDAIALSIERLTQPVKTESALLSKGQESYIANDTWIDSHLVGLEYNRVPRNKGIDAILKQSMDGLLPIIRVQRLNEPLLETIRALKSATKTKKNIQLIVIATCPELFEIYEQDLIVIPSPSIQIQRYLHKAYSKQRVA